MQHVACNNVLHQHAASVWLERYLSWSSRLVKLVTFSSRPSAMALGAFIVTYAPLCALSFIRSKRGPGGTPDWVLDVARMVLFLNSALNPLIYSFRSREFREAFLRLLGCHVPTVAPAGMRVSVTAGHSEPPDGGAVSTELRSVNTGLHHR